MTDGDYSGYVRVRPCAVRFTGLPTGSLCCSLPDAAAQATRAPGPCPTRTPGKAAIIVPYVDINPHKSRPKWQGYAILAILLFLTAGVVSAALLHH